LGLGWGTLPVSRPSSLTRGLLLDLCVWSFEQLTFPAVRATAPASTWTRGEHFFLLAQTVLFGLVTQRILGARDGQRRRRERQRPLAR
jgi:hypothetical protein